MNINLNKRNLKYYFQCDSKETQDHIFENCYSIRGCPYITSSAEGGMGSFCQNMTIDDIYLGGSPPKNMTI